MVIENLLELTTRAVATAIAPTDAPTESPVNRGYCDEESGRSRWSGRHLNLSRYTLHTVGWDDCSAMIAKETPKKSPTATMHEQA